MLSCPVWEATASSGTQPQGPAAADQPRDGFAVPFPFSWNIWRCPAGTGVSGGTING
jgi:hypothetical protein